MLLEMLIGDIALSADLYKELDSEPSTLLHPGHRVENEGNTEKPQTGLGSPGALDDSALTTSAELETKHKYVKCNNHGPCNPTNRAPYFGP